MASCLMFNQIMGPSLGHLSPQAFSMAATKPSLVGWPQQKTLYPGTRLKKKDQLIDIVYKIFYNIFYKSCLWKVTPLRNNF